MIYLGRLVAIAAFSLFLHIVLGWGWTLLAGAAAGLWIGRGGWHLGALGVGLDWLVLIAYNYVVDARAVHLMTETMGSMLGNLPFFAVVAFTLLIGAVLGGLGGAAGTQLHRIINFKRTQAA